MIGLNNLTRTQKSQNSWSPLMELREEIDRFSEAWYPPCDVLEAENHHLLTVELAGIPRDQVQVEAVDNRLLIFGERKIEDKNPEGELYYSERRYGKFRRVFTLAKGTDPDKIEANFQDGVLRILIPKAENVKSRKIKIGTGSSFLEKLIGQSPPRAKEFDHSFSEKSDKMVS